MRTPRAPSLAAVLTVACAWALAAASSAKAGPGPGASPSPGGSAPVEESVAERRAVRGGALEDAGESPELRELRRFEEQAFPRSAVPSDDDELGGAPPPDLPGHWEGTGDIPSQLRSTQIGAVPSAPRPPDSEWLRSLKLPDLPMRWDPQVLRYLDYFKNDTRGHLIMAGWLRRLGRYRALFESVLDREGLPKDLVYLSMIESGFETGAKSRVGAGGLWQFMPSAARAYGLEVSYWVDARRDPERSAAAAARYLKDLYARFGSWHLVFAAYNAGYGAVLKSIARYNTNDYWELIRHEAGLPWESSIYVPKILAAAVVGHNMEAFGFADVVSDPPFSYDWVDATSGTSLAQLARMAGTSIETLSSLNPQLIRDRTPPDRAEARLRVPAGTAVSFVENLRRSPAAPDTDVVVLRFGETLDDIAKARGCSARELRKLNGVKESAELRAGVAILVPKRKGAPVERVAGAPTDDSPVTEPTSAQDEDEVLVAVPDRTFSYEGRDRVFYRLRDGDDLEAIASTFHVRIDDLVEWNNLDPTARLHPKMVLQIFVTKDFDPTGVFLLDAAKIRVVTLGSDEFLELEAARRGKKRLVYEARNGDTLAKVGRRYGLTPGDLARINRFSYNTELRPGQKIIVYSPVGPNGRELAQGLTPEPRRDAPRDRGLAALATKPSRPGVGPRAEDKREVHGPATNVAGKTKRTEPPAFTPRPRPAAAPGKAVPTRNGKPEAPKAKGEAKPSPAPSRPPGAPGRPGAAKKPNARP